MSQGRCSSTKSIVPALWSVLVRHKGFPRSNVHHLRPKHHWSSVVRYNHHTTNTQKLHLDQLSRNELVDHQKLSHNEPVDHNEIVGAPWDDVTDVLEVAHDPRRDELLAIEHVNVFTREVPTGRPEKRRARIRAAVAWSQVHKENKAKRRAELADVKSPNIDWRSCLRLLQLETIDPDQHVVRYIPTTNRWPVTQTRADQIRQPEVWTVDSFRYYVQSLATSYHSPLRRRHLYKEGESHVSAVGDLLDELLQDNSLVPYWSVAACNEALKFFSKHSMMHRIRMLFSRMDTLRFVTSTETFNIMLLVAAKEKRFSQFPGLLYSMRRRNLKPDVGTWQAFFLVSNKDARCEIMLSMLERGLLSKSWSMSKFFSLNVPEILHVTFDQGHSTEWLLAYLDNLDEFDWLTTPTGNTIIDEAGKRGVGEDALDMLDQMLERGMVPDKITLCILLHRCLPDKNYRLALRVLRKLPHEMIPPDETAYEALFTLFWRCRHYNCAKVVWRYACLEGYTSFKLRLIVGRSILDEPAPAKQTPPKRTQAWKQYVGKVVLGVNFGLPEPNCTLREQIQKSITAPQVESTRDAWSALFDQDLAAAHRYKAVRSLADLLDDALAMDREWEADRIWRDTPLSWMWENSIPVRLQRTDIITTEEEEEEGARPGRLIRWVPIQAREPQAPLIV
ncbi:MAG: hypothetical protein Q9191_006614 [Dirinaria sp. TL-2023a]